MARAVAFLDNLSFLMIVLMNCFFFYFLYSADFGISETVVFVVTLSRNRHLVFPGSINHEGLNSLAPEFKFPYSRIVKVLLHTMLMEDILH